MPAPINSVRTRVIDTGSGYVAQMTCDGLMWYDLPDPFLLGVRESHCLSDITYYATRIALAASKSMSTGKVVWRSDAK